MEDYQVGQQAFTFFKRVKLRNEIQRDKKIKRRNKKIEDPRRMRYGNIRHKLEDIIIMRLCTVICGGKDCADMEVFAVERKDFLRKFLELPNGIPDVNQHKCVTLFKKNILTKIKKYVIITRVRARVLYLVL